ncbi:hypothetical protein DLAC_07160 [Tieghemostelium lacteum]|uniref:Uncharacterized protein n=1 Tax=Tieghemostelium lacteum TaxID=361077 RepID=A0A151ZD92_TIELA|nr:hypothetical protein DLAC_07160 [Tieghemostelium lacteum]|eukprot:KYQ91922.1 hypothetical protein DLAC_07160 [Tieghemostelium lacteum]
MDRAIKNFIGRENELKDLEDHLNGTGSVVIKGIDGVGKHSLVSQFMKENHKKYDFVYFIEDLDLSIQNLFESLDKMYPTAIKTLDGYFSVMGSFLLVIGDIGKCREKKFFEAHFQVIAEAVNAKLKKHVIYIAQENKYDRNAKRIVLSNLTESESIQLVKTTLKDKDTEESKLLALAKVSQGYPILIDLLAKYINNQQVNDIDSELGKVSEEDKQDPIKFYQSLLSLVIKEMRDKQNFPLDLYKILVWFAHFAIKLDWFEVLNELIFKYGHRDVSDMFDYLKKYSIINSSTTKASIFYISNKVLHSLRSLLSPEEAQDGLDQFTDAIVGLVNVASIEPIDIPMILSHGIYASDNYDLSKSILISVAGLQLTIVDLYFSVFNVASEALYYSKIAKKTLKTAEETIPVHPFVNQLKYRSHRHLGVIYSLHPPDQKKSFKHLLKAKEYFKYVEDLLKQANPDEIHFLNLNLGMGYLHQGDFKKAQTIFEDLIENIQDKENSLDYCKALNNLGFVQQKLGDHKKAIYYYRQSIQATNKIFGENNQNSISTTRNLFEVYVEMRDFKKAKELINIITDAFTHDPTTQKQIRIELETEIEIAKENYSNKALTIGYKHYAMAGVLLGLGLLAFKLLKK